MRKFFAEGDAGGDAAAAAAAKAAADAAPKFTQETWREMLPADLRSHPSLAKTANVEALTRSYISAQSLIGQDPNRLAVIPANGDDAALAAHMDKLGRPKDATGYKLEPAKDGPAWLAPTEPLVKGLTEQAHKLGILPRQLQGIYSWFSGQMASTAKEVEAGRDAAHAAEIKEMEAKYPGDQYARLTGDANLAIDFLGGKDFADALSEAGLGTRLIVVEGLAKVGALLREDKVGGGSGGGGGGEADTLLSQANEMTQRAVDSKNPRERRDLSEKAAALRARANAISKRKTA